MPAAMPRQNATINFIWWAAIASGYGKAILVAPRSCLRRKPRDSQMRTYIIHILRDYMRVFLARARSRYRSSVTGHTECRFALVNACARLADWTAVACDGRQPWKILGLYFIDYSRVALVYSQPLSIYVIINFGDTIFAIITLYGGCIFAWSLHGTYFHMAQYISFAALLRRP